MTASEEQMIVKNCILYYTRPRENQKLSSVSSTVEMIEHIQRKLHKGITCGFVSKENPLSNKREVPLAGKYQ